ncbi:P-loop containing nucleoside triphosphate hydrolase protein [Amylostereum chailletii]|nr:P-loop containing nucleoside triphosphate hydrolase protein [Amylostereum chailletii]
MSQYSFNTSTDSNFHEPDPGAVGMSDPAVSAARRRKLDIINRLKSAGAQFELDIPTIAAIGAQSAGKSSLIEAISGITLPRASGTCTRSPTEVQLTYSDEPWQCAVILSISTDAQGNTHPTLNHTFGQPVTNKSDVTERIRLAQLAILNPNEEADYFLQGTLPAGGQSQLSFSPNCVVLKIKGRDVTDLNFIDLPGFIAGGDAEDRSLIENLARYYVSKPSCIILLTVTCETDFENQTAYAFAGLYDQDGSRTVGVLTKPDRIQPGDEVPWTQLVTGEADTARNIQWFCIKNPGSQQIAQGITWEDARAAESEWFATTAPWSALGVVGTERLGTGVLTRRLSDLLSDLITARLPEIRQEVEGFLARTTEDINRLPQPPSTEPVSAIIQLVVDFTRDVEKNVQGLPGKGGLLQTIRPFDQEFHQAIRRTAPDFRPYKRGSRHSTPVPSPDFLQNEEDLSSISPTSGDEIYIEDVMEIARDAVTRELPQNYPFLVQKEAIQRVVDKWDAPSRQLFASTKETLSARIMRLVDQHFGLHTLGGLKHQIASIVTTHLGVRASEALSRLEFILQVEHEPATRNTHYFTATRDKFLALYKGSYHSSGDFIAGLRRSQSSLTMALDGLHQIPRFGNVTPVDLGMLLPTDQVDSALWIMAGVRAYFQVAYKRFVDNIPMTLDQELVRGVHVGLQAAILSGLGVDAVDNVERCRKLLREPAYIATKRDELILRRDRLTRARDEMLDEFI